MKRLLIGLLATFILTIVLDNWLQLGVLELLALDPRVLDYQTAWQLLTYVVVAPPQAAMQFLIGLLFFWWVVAPFEERYGARRTAQLCAVGALSGSLLALVAGQIFPAHSGHVYGIGPIIVAAIAAFAWSIRNSGTPISFFGVLPMRPVHLILLVIGLSALFFLIDKNVASLAADLGAVGGGILFVEWMTRPRSPKKKPSPERKRPSKSSPFRVIQGGGEGGDSDEDRPRWLN